MARPFTISVPDEILQDLDDRLKNTRWPDQVRGAGWDHGTDPDYLKELVHYWQDSFDWRRQEDKLNELSHFQAEIDGLGVHFVHERGKGEKPMPLLLLHGWPSSFWQMTKIVPLLTDPEAHGGRADDSFDVIVPSLPGFGFSDRPEEKGMSIFRMAELFGRLMSEELGIERYLVRASDLATGIAQRLAQVCPERIIGLHLSGANPFVWMPPADMSEAEKQFWQAGRQWQMREGAYNMVQSTKPQTLSYGLNDSPSGMAAWIVEKFRSWSDCGGDVEKRFSRDELLTNLTIYWATETFGSSIRVYYESVRNIPADVEKYVEVPTAMAIPLKGLVPQPREWAERFFNVVQWTELEQGGHFIEWEEPELMAEDIRTFVRPFRKRPLSAIRSRSSKRRGR